MKRESTTTEFDDGDNRKIDETEDSALLKRDEMASERTHKTVGDTTTDEEDDNNDDDDDDDGYFADVGFLFDDDGEHCPTRVETFAWDVVGPQETRRSVRVQLRVVDDDDPDRSVVSGHYLWPAARGLADYMVQQYNRQQQERTQRQEQHDHDNLQIIENHDNGNIDDDDESTDDNSSRTTDNNNTSLLPSAPTSVVELGAGCALLGCVALQLWSTGLECVVVTDQNAAVLERARDNYESTLQALLDRSVGEDDLNAAINDTASVHFALRRLSWGDDDAVAAVRALLGEHQSSSTPSSRSSPQRRIRSQHQHHQHHHATTSRRAQVILASDVLHEAAVVEPLLQTARDLLAANGIFLLAQSFHLTDESIQEAVETACFRYGLVGVIRVDDPALRIREFRLADEVEELSSTTTTDPFLDDEGISETPAIRNEHDTTSTKEEKQERDG